MENDREHKNEISSIASNFDLVLYSLLAAAFILYGMYSLLRHLWSSGIGYFVVGTLIFSSMIIQIGHDLYHKRIGTVSKFVLGILALTTIIIIFVDLFSTL
jgi:hypothetical protein